MSSQLFSLQGKVVVLTGATQGIGEGLASGLAEAGAELVIVHRSTTDPSRVVKKYESLGAPKVSTVVADMSNNAEVDEILPAALKLSSTGSVDVLFNNAGITSRGLALDVSDEDWNRVLQVNLTTPFRLARAFGNYWVKEGKKGKIINTGSLFSVFGGSNVIPYTASKHAINAITKTLSNEWAGKGITVNTIIPGYIVTNMTSNGVMKNEAVAERLLTRIPAGRWGNIDDFKGPAVFLASSASDYVTGGSIDVDGGFIAN